MDSRRKIDKLLGEAKQSKSIRVLEPKGLPRGVPNSKLPSDLLYFYNLCGGVIFYEGSDIQINFVQPSEFVVTNELLEPVKDFISHDDISYEWYLVAECPGGEQRVSIDLNPYRLGRCYDSFWQNHAIQGSCFIMALSFSELFCNVLEKKESAWEWFNGDFISLGDPYQHL